MPRQQMDHQRSSRIMIIIVLFLALIMEPIIPSVVPPSQRPPILLKFSTKSSLLHQNPSFPGFSRYFPKKKRRHFALWIFSSFLFGIFVPSTSRFFQSSWMAGLRSWWIPLLLPVMAPVWSASGGGMEEWEGGYNLEKVDGDDGNYVS